MALIIRANRSISTPIDSSKTSSSSLVDPDWELIDPNPEVIILFQQYDLKFFNGRLAGCEVKWSNRMTSCAGVCCYEGRGGLCSIRLSQPLLKFRPRKDLVETLLHEMIHAFLFVAQRNRDHDCHGPQFQALMHRINAEAGTNISIYHSFHAEVNEHKRHWWRCEGPCRNQGPYFGWVKRAMNRAPGPNDFWFDGHRLQCGGKFVKVKEPEKSDKKRKAASEKSELRKLLCVVPNTSTSTTLDAYFDKLPGSGNSLPFKNSTSDVPSKKNKIEMVDLTENEATLGFGDYLNCPVCSQKVHEDLINAHVDACLNGH